LPTARNTFKTSQTGTIENLSAGDVCPAPSEIKNSLFENHRQLLNRNCKIAIINNLSKVSCWITSGHVLGMLGSDWLSAGTLHCDWLVGDAREVAVKQSQQLHAVILAGSR